MLHDAFNFCAHLGLNPLPAVENSSALQAREGSAHWIFGWILGPSAAFKLGARVWCLRAELAGHWCRHTPFFLSTQARIRACWRCQSTSLNLFTRALCILCFFFSSWAINSLFSLLSSHFQMASDREIWSIYVEIHISGTQGANTTPVCASTQ